MVFGSLLRTIRLQRYLTQREFSEYVDIPLSTLKQWEKGLYLPSLTNFKKLLRCKNFTMKLKNELKTAYERDKIECMNNL